jgi:hypothetical protein
LGTMSFRTSSQVLLSNSVVVVLEVMFVGTKPCNYLQKSWETSYNYMFCPCCKISFDYAIAAVIPTPVTSSHVTISEPLVERRENTLAHENSGIQSLRVIFDPSDFRTCVIPTLKLSRDRLKF